jgi:hypothetical protein
MPRRKVKEPTLTEIANRIFEHLRRFEADPKINRVEEGMHPYFRAGSRRIGSRVVVNYISYQGHHGLTRADAERYLAKLDAGFVGRHWEALR